VIRESIDIHAETMNTIRLITVSCKIRAKLPVYSPWSELSPPAYSLASSSFAAVS
jgi:hypothetical protein